MLERIPVNTVLPYKGIGFGVCVGGLKARLEAAAGCWKIQVQKVKSPPRYFVSTTWICQLAQFVNQEVELIGQLAEFIGGRKPLMDFFPF